MEDQVPANRLYVGNLPWSTDVDELRAIFSSCGAITHVDIPKGRQGRSRGYGIVEYSSAAEAQAAIAQLEGARPPRFSFPYSFARIGVSASAWGSRARANANAIRAPPIRAGQRRFIDRTIERPIAPRSDRARAIDPPRTNADEPPPFFRPLPPGHTLGDRNLTVREDNAPTKTANSGGGSKSGGGRGSGNVMGETPAAEGCRCYIGNLAWETTAESLVGAFEDYRPRLAAGAGFRRAKARDRDGGDGAVVVVVASFALFFFLLPGWSLVRGARLFLFSSLWGWKLTTALLPLLNNDSALLLRRLRRQR